MALFQHVQVFTVILTLGLAEGSRQVLGLKGRTTQVAGLLLPQPERDAEPFLALGTDKSGSITDFLVNRLENHTFFCL